MKKHDSNSAMGRLANFIEETYDASIVTLHPLASSWKQVYQVQRATGPDWVVRLFPPADEHSPALTVTMQAALLLHMERAAFPAEQVVRANDGTAVTIYAGQPVLITTYLGPSLQAWQATRGATELTQPGADAAPVDYAPATLRAWGVALGRLHALPLPADLPLPITNERPRPQLTWATDELAGIAEQVPPALQGEYQALLHTLRTIDHCEDLPFTLIHGDCALGNAIQLPTGEVALIDWDWAGLGPAVVDLGWLLSNTFDKAERTINQAAIAALVAGYCQERHPTAAELHRLSDAIQFHTLKLLAAFFPERIGEQWRADELIYGATYATWQTQWSASAEIARLAQKRFAEFVD